MTVSFEVETVLAQDISPVCPMVFPDVAEFPSTKEETELHAVPVHSLTPAVAVVVLAVRYRI